MIICLNEKSATPRCRIIDRLSYSRIDDIDDKLDDRSRRIKLTVISTSISHILKKSLIDIREIEEVFLILKIEIIDDIYNFANIISILDFI